uniref:Uncharacterized protein n=1 Tax=Sphaerodactylus townsendi TaxID=933632 RepID=A0ACB8EXJ0_9SAUR
MSSQLTVPSVDFEKNTYTCIVKHSAFTDRQGQRKRIEKRDCVETEPIQVQPINPWLHRNIELYNTSNHRACYKSMQAPTVSITKPSYRDLVEGTAAVTCLVEGSFQEISDHLDCEQQA